MELQQLRYFLEVARTQHISKSAQKLLIAQPALSQSIHRLEKELGVKLFEKVGRNIVLTPYGKHLQKRVEPLLNTLDTLPEELQELYNENYSVIKINVLAASYIITQAIIEYQKHHPESRFQLSQSEDEQQCDITVTTDIKHIHSREDFFSLTEKIYLAVPNNEKYAKLKSIPLKSVEKENFITLSGSKQLRNICDRYCHQAGISPKYVFESDNPDAAKNTIGANIGIGFWPQYSWGRLKDDKVKLLKISDPKCYREIVVNCNNTENENATHFFQFLKEYLLSKRPEGYAV